MTYLKEYEKLNVYQKQAADVVDGPALVLAGAGAGKTASMTVRISKLIKEHNVAPGEIFCATFTNKAAAEMRERLDQMIGKENAQGIWMGTFHSMCVRILRRESWRLGFKKDEQGFSSFTIYDTDDQKEVMGKVLRSMGIEKKVKDTSVLAYIDDCKNKLWDPAYALENNAETYTTELYAMAYERYQKELLRNNAMDFGDLIFNTVVILRDFPEAQSYWQGKFRYVLVDEFQDTNYSQLQLLLFIGAPEFNIFAIGDDAQSIYAFRGSDISIILGFEKMFPHGQVINLKINYRSTDTIVNSGNALISNNKEQLEKDIEAFNKKEHPIVKVMTQDEVQESHFIASFIKSRVKKEQNEYKDFSVLYRNNFHSRVIEESFMKLGIPYIIRGGHSFFSREEIKDILAYLRIIFNKEDDISALRVINKPRRSIGDKTIKVIEDFARMQDMSFYNALKAKEHISSLTVRQKNSIDLFLSIISSLEELVEQENILPSQVVSKAIERSNIMKHYEKDEKKDDREENLNELVQLFKDREAAEPEKELKEIIQELSLLSQASNDEGADVVELMTIHASKGLEFPVCILPGWVEGTFPSMRSIQDQQVEEERRVAYVGITRAEQEVLLLSTKTRRDFSGKINYVEPSRFVDEIPEEYSHPLDLTERKKQKF